MFGNARNAAPLSRGTGYMTEDALLCRKGAAWRGQILVLGSLCALALLLIYIVGSPRSWATHRLEVLLTLGGIAFWRWSWFVIQNVRAITYRYWAFPRIRREAELALAKFGPVPEVTVLGTTYHEKPWITLAVFGSVFRELSTIEGLLNAAWT